MTVIGSPFPGERFRAARLRARCVTCLLLAAWVLMGAGEADFSGGRLNIDRIIAVIDGDLVTYSDVLTQVELFKRQRQSILPAEEIGAPATDKEMLLRAFKEVVVRRLLYPEATKLNVVAVEEQEVDAALEELVAEFASRNEYERFCYVLGLREEQMRFLVQQFLVCRAYVEKKIGLQVRINLKAYHEDHRDRYGGLELEDVRDRVEADLYREKLDAWFSDVLERADIRILYKTYAKALR